MHGACGQYEDALKAGSARPLLDALKYFFAIALALALRRHRERRHLASFRFRIRVERSAGKDHAVVLNDAVMAGIAFNLGPVTLDQRAVLFKRLNQLQDAAHVIGRGFSQALQLFIDDHGAYAVMHIDFQQQRPVHGEGQNVAALDARLAGLDAVLQVKRCICRLCRIGQLRQQFFGSRKRQFRINGIVFAFGFAGMGADAGDFGQKNQFIGLQFDRHTGRNFFHREVEGFASRRKTER